MLLQCPAIWDESHDPEDHDWKDGLEAGVFDWECAQIVAFLAVDWEVEALGDSLVVPVDDFAV